MIGRLPALVVWLAVGHAVIGGFYWALINVPESSVFMLVLSGILVVLIAGSAGWVSMTALFVWLPGTAWREAMRRGARAVPGFVAGLVFFAAIWWVVGLAADWFAMRSGEIDAWMMMRFRSPNTAWLHRTIALVLAVVRDIVGLSLAVALAAWVGAKGWRQLLGSSWIRAALSRRHLATVGLAIVLLVALPWRAIDWRPAALPPTWLEPAFVGLKLAVIYVLLNLGWGYVLRAGAEGLTRSTTS